MSNLRKYNFDTRHGGRQAADRECAQAEVSRVLPTHRTMALDSAESIFRAALDELGVSHSGIDDSALPALFRVASRVGRIDAAGMIHRPLAHDAKAAASFEARFPEAARVRFA